MRTNREIESGKEVTPVIRRSPEEIQARIKELQELIDFAGSVAQFAESYNFKSRRMRRARRELEWVLGKDVRVQEDF